MIRNVNFRLSLLFVAAAALAWTPADAKPARCFSTDDGHFPCEFTATDKNGSFEITGEDVGYVLLVGRPGVALGFVILGGKSVALPGEYIRSRKDGACWDNADTQTRLCAW